MKERQAPTPFLSSDNQLAILRKSLCVAEAQFPQLEDASKTPTSQGPQGSPGTRTHSKHPIKEGCTLPFNNKGTSLQSWLQ